MTASNVSSDWGDHFEKCSRHNEKYHKSEGQCDYCVQAAEVIAAAGLCPKCAEDDCDVLGVKGSWYLHCNDCGHNSGEEYFMGDLAVEDWPEDQYEETAPLKS